MRVDLLVHRFFSLLSAREWHEFAELLADDVERIGPFGDRLTGRNRYLDFLSGTVPSRYRNDVLRIASSRDGRSAFARVTERLHYEDSEIKLEEAYAFDLDEDGFIRRIEIFWQTPEADPGGFGSATSDESYSSKNRQEYV